MFSSTEYTRSRELDGEDAMATTVLETERLRLRAWETEDTAEFARSCNTETVMRWLGGVQSAEELVEDVEYFSDCEAEDGHTFWVMERKSDGGFLGFCGLIVVPDPDSTVDGEVEIGWRVRADQWRRGYAEEAARACLDYGFSTLGLEQIVSRTAEGNIPSQELMAKLGMRHRPELDYDPDDGSDRLLVFSIDAPIARRRARLRRKAA